MIRKSADSDDSDNDKGIVVNVVSESNNHDDSDDHKTEEEEEEDGNDCAEGTEGNYDADDTDGNSNGYDFFLSEVYHYDNNENSGENGYKNSEYEKDIECYSEYNKTDYNRKIERKK